MPAVKATESRPELTFDDPEAGWWALARVIAGQAGPMTRADRRAEVQRRLALEEQGRRRWQELLEQRNAPRRSFWTEARTDGSNRSNPRPGDWVEVALKDCLRPFGVRVARVLEILPANPEAGRHRDDMLLLEVPGWRLKLERAPENVTVLRGGKAALEVRCSE